ncbi:MAG: hypothetical protein R6V56_00905 [Lentisphaeria bacterium]
MFALLVCGFCRFPIGLFQTAVGGSKIETWLNQKPYGEGGNYNRLIKPRPDGKLEWLAIQAKDGKWHWADGRIEGSELIVSAKGVKEPKAVRYAYTTQPLGNLLYSTDAMPVGPFTTCGYDKNSAPDRD